jgi:hypothetical protein
MQFVKIERYLKNGKKRELDNPAADKLSRFRNGWFRWGDWYLDQSPEANSAYLTTPKLNVVWLGRRSAKELTWYDHPSADNDDFESGKYEIVYSFDTYLAYKQELMYHILWKATFTYEGPSENYTNRNPKYAILKGERLLKTENQPKLLYGPFKNKDASDRYTWPNPLYSE